MSEAAANPVRKVWRLKKADENQVTCLSEALGVSRVTARLLCIRGLTEPEAADPFLRADLELLHDPFLFTQMETAVQRLLEIRENGDRVLVHGDYDVDGLSATALLASGFGELGIETDTFIPNRLIDSYGLQREKVLAAAEEGYAAVVTVDCGISEKETIRLAREKGIDIILTDHHQPPADLPEPLALINPHAPGESYPCKDLCGVGVAWKLLQALTMRAEGLDADTAIDRFLPLMDCVALGTVADVMPVIGENRGLIRLGLSAIQNETRPGLRALIDAAGLAARRIGVEDIAFYIAPRLNALGRLGDAREGVELLTTLNLSRAEQIAAILEEVNNERRTYQEQTFRSCLAAIEGDPAILENRFVVLASEEWRRGIVGIVAGKVVDRYHRPAALMAIEDGVAHGSARSIPGYNIVEALASATDLLDAYGGHEAAAGFRLPADRVPDLRRRLAEHAAGHIPDHALSPLLEIDAVVELPEINERLIAELDLLEPYGPQNRKPVLAAVDLRADSRTRIVKNNHLKIGLTRQGHQIDGIAFGMGDQMPMVLEGPIDVAFRPTMNEWQDRRTVQLQIVDLRRAASAGAEGGQTASERVNDPAPAAGRIAIVDGRNTADKAKSIFKALEDGRRGVFFCESDEGRKSLARILGRTQIESALDLPGELADLIREEGGLLVRMKADGEPEPGLGHVFLYDLPRGPRKPKRIADAVRKLSGAVKIHLLYGGGEAESAARDVAAFLPDRDTMGRIYKCLKDTADEHGNAHRDAVERNLAEAGIAASVLDRAGPVLDELFLVKRLPDGAGYQLVKVTGRRDLSESPAFRRIEAQRRKLLDFHQSLLTLPPDRAGALLGFGD